MKLEETKTLLELDLVSNFNLTLEQQQRLKKLLENYRRVFVPKERNSRQNSRVKHYIDIRTHPSIKKKLQRTGPYEEKVIKREIDGML